jgi:signal peptidase I
MRSKEVTAFFLDKHTPHRYTAGCKSVVRIEAMIDPNVNPQGQQPLSEPAPVAPAGAGAAIWHMAREVFQVMAPALVLALVVHLFLAQATVVYGQSMEPNLHAQQRLIVDKLSYRIHSPQRNDIVVVDLPSMDEMLVKRIVALPGERVEVRGGVVYVNDVPIPEPYPHDRTAYDMAPITLGPLSYFVMGDNRGNSNDSRSFGPITRDEVVGRVWLRYWPLDKFVIF